MISLANRRSRHGADLTEPIDMNRSTVASNYRSTATTPLIWCIRVALLLVVAVVGLFYVYPRIHDLTATPYRLDAAVESAGNYNPALDRIVEHETVTLASFDSLDSMKLSLRDVLATNEMVSAELNTLIDQISVDVQGTLDSAGANVDELVASLESLTSQINSLQSPIDAAASGLRSDRATLDEILVDARATASQVHNARMSAEESADDLSGR